MSLLSQVWSRVRRGARRSKKYAAPRAQLELETLENRETPAAGMAVGMNLEWVQDYSPALTFRDAFLSSRSWFSHSYNEATRLFSFTGGGDVHLDEHGWPTQLNAFTNAQGQAVQQQLGTVMFDAINGAYPGGVYRAEWEGAGTLAWLGDASVREMGDMAGGRHYALLNVTPSNAGITMRITAVSEANPVHNVHLWMPDY